MNEMQIGEFQMRQLLLKAFRIIRGPADALLSVAVVPAAYLFLFFRSIGAHRLPLTTRRLKEIGVYPVRDHYYDPMFNDNHLLKPLNNDRDLPGLNLNTGKQLEFLSQLNSSEELRKLRLDHPAKTPLDFSMENESFKSGDADFLYQIIRRLKPSKIVEIGSGSSTKIARLAVDKNQIETGKSTTHICVEPYEQSWLEDVSGITLVRERIEMFDYDWAKELGEGDLLFVDSSHIIRPQGDVVTEYLQIFPKLNKGVVVHVHDIFTPKDYPKGWVVDRVLFWNEQYLLEALLTHTEKYEVVAALNYLKHRHYEELSKVCPYLTKDREPGSFYFKVVS